MDDSHSFSAAILRSRKLKACSRSDDPDRILPCASDTPMHRVISECLSRSYDPDKCKHINANEAICKLNQLYEDMVSIEK